MAEKKTKRQVTGSPLKSKMRSEKETAKESRKKPVTRKLTDAKKRKVVC